MTKRITNFIVVWLISLFLPINVFAGLKINEIYPAPATGEYEWVEFYNDQDTVVDLSAYQLIDLANNKIKIPTGFISPADFIIATASSVLNNTGDTVYLKNISGEVIDTVVYSESFSSDKTYTRCPDGNGQWLVSSVITKNTSNTPSCLILTPTSNPTLPQTTPTISTPTDTGTTYPTVEPTTTTIHQSYDNIYISEIMVNPQIDENEWIEVYNDNDFAVFLDNWYLDDLENAGSSPKLFSLTIPAKGYAIYELSVSMFNNDTDNVRLLDLNKNLKDSFEYPKSEKGLSWGRISFDQDQYCLQNPNKNSSNSNCIDSINITSSIKQPTPTTTVIPGKIKSPTPQPTKISIINQTKKIIPTSNFKDAYQPGSVLGASNKDKFNDQQLVIRVCAFASITHSVLTIAFLFLRIKIHEGI